MQGWEPAVLDWLSASLPARGPIGSSHWQAAKLPHLPDNHNETTIMMMMVNLMTVMMTLDQLSHSIDQHQIPLKSPDHH